MKQKFLRLIAALATGYVAGKVVFFTTHGSGVTAMIALLVAAFAAYTFFTPASAKS